MLLDILKSNRKVTKILSQTMEYPIKKNIQINATTTKLSQTQQGSKTANNREPNKKNHTGQTHKCTFSAVRFRMVVCVPSFYVQFKHAMYVPCSVCIYERAPISYKIHIHFFDCCFLFVCSYFECFFFSNDFIIDFIFTLCVGVQTKMLATFCQISVLLFFVPTFRKKGSFVIII